MLDFVQKIIGTNLEKNFVFRRLCHLWWSYLNDNQTFPLLICEELANYDCFNGGVNGYGILNMVARSKYDKRISNAEVVVFTFITQDFNRG